jgi:hypothetical protein
MNNKINKLTRNRFEAIVQDVTESSKNYLKQEFKDLLESNKPYTTKADHISYSITSIDEKISLLDDQLKELQEYKKRLKSAKEIVLTSGAEVFNEYGISKIEGGVFSSITTTKELTSTKLQITVINEQALVDAGIYKKVIDTKLIEEYYSNDEYKELIKAHTDIKTVTTVKPSKLKINKRRASNTSNLTNISDVA